MVCWYVMLGKILLRVVRSVSMALRFTSLIGVGYAVLQCKTVIFGHAIFRKSEITKIGARRRNPCQSAQDESGFRLGVLSAPKACSVPRKIRFSFYMWFSVKMKQLRRVVASSSVAIVQITARAFERAYWGLLGAKIRRDRAWSSLAKLS